jgi:hypothetical protein
MTRSTAPDRTATRFLGLPGTRLGRSSLWLVVACLACLGLWLLEAKLPRDRSTFFSDPLMAALIICTACAGNACWVTAILAFVLKREKSLLLVLPLLLGGIVLLFTLGELGGH